VDLLLTISNVSCLSLLWRKNSQVVGSINPLKNNRQYFALKVDASGNLRKEYPDKVWPFTCQGIELYCYQEHIGQWNVVVKDTGLPITASKFSRNDAMAQTREKIRREGLEKVAQDISLAQNALNAINIYEEINE
jgi:hypothetical protein